MLEVDALRTRGVKAVWYWKSDVARGALCETYLEVDMETPWVPCLTWATMSRGSGL